MLLESKAGNAPENWLRLNLREYGRIRPYSVHRFFKRICALLIPKRLKREFCHNDSRAIYEHSMLKRQVYAHGSRVLRCKRLRRKRNSIPAPVQNTAKAAQCKLFFRWPALAKLFANASCVCFRALQARLSRFLRARDALRLWRNPLRASVKSVRRSPPTTVQQGAAPDRLPPAFCTFRVCVGGG